MIIRVVKPAATSELLHEWYVEHGVGSVPQGDGFGIERNTRSERRAARFERTNSGGSVRDR